MARQLKAGEIINRTAVEVGLRQVPDPFSSQDEAFSQMVGLLNVAGQELVELSDWPELLRPYQQLTESGDTGLYDLPDDYDHFINQTGWDRTNDVPVIGPLSPQDWAYLLGRDFEANSIYVAYRIFGSQMEVYPQPPPVGVSINFEYISRNWAKDSAGDLRDNCTEAADTVLLDPLLMQKFLKVKFLNAKNLPSQAAMIEFENVLGNRQGTSAGSQILKAGGGSGKFPYLNGFFNTPDTNYGL